MLKKINALIIALLIAVNAYGAIVISTYKKPKVIKYKYKLTERGKVLKTPQKILFDYDSSTVDLKKYFKTLKYVGDVTTSTNIISIIIEGHMSSDETKKPTNGYGKKDILFTFTGRQLLPHDFRRMISFRTYRRECSQSAHLLVHPFRYFHLFIWIFLFLALVSRRSHSF